MPDQSYEEMREENIKLKKAAAKAEIEMKKQKCKIKMARDNEVINHHLAQDAEKERTSNRYNNRDDNRGMQDKGWVRLLLTREGIFA